MNLTKRSFRFGGLYRHPDFMKLWAGQTISQFGSRITRGALPLTAILILGATPVQMGLLAALAALPTLTLGLFVGVWVDRLRRRPLMIAADVGRLLILLSVPIAALIGRLSIGLIYAVALASGVLTLLFDVAYQSVLPALIRPENVLEGNTKLATTDALAEIGGPALAGGLVQVISAPLAILFDAVSFAVSAVSLALIRSPEALLGAPDSESTMWREITDGWRVILCQPVLRAMAIGSCARTFFGNFYAALYSLYVIRAVGLTPAIEGVLIAGGGVGGLLGALLAERLPRRFGLGRVLSGALLGSAVVGLLTPLAGGVALLAAAILFIPQVIGDGLITIYMINELSLRQRLVPNQLLGRANATSAFLAQLTAPFGALIGGALGERFGTRTALTIAALGMLITALSMARSALSSASTTISEVFNSEEEQ